MPGKAPTLITVPDSLLQEFSDFLVTQIGLCFPRKRWPDLLRGMSALAKELNLPGPELCMRKLMHASLSRHQVEMLAHHLSVGETYFFRDPAMFAALQLEVLPRLIEARRTSGKRLRIWSAGCCTGEEAYSIAILIGTLIPDLGEWNISILGTDIHPGFLKKAEHGVYREWSFRGVPQAIRECNFDQPQPGCYAIKPGLRRLVSFDHLNLVSDVYPALANNSNAMDIILCRNVLMYFEQFQIRRVVRKLHHALVEGGWLIVSSSEAGQQLFTDFSPVNFPGAMFYRKETEQPAVPETAAAFPHNDLPQRRHQEQAADRARLKKSAAQTAPSQTTAPYETALAYYDKGAYQQAVDVLMALACRGPRELALLARAHANQGQLQEAGSWCAAAIAADKCNPGLRYLQAVILEEQGAMEMAKAALKSALYLDQNFVLAHYALGNLCRRQGNAGDAARHFRHTVDLLHAYPAAGILPESEGLAAARLIEIIRAREGIA